MIHRLGLAALALIALAPPTAADRISVPPPPPPPAATGPAVAVALVIEGDVIHLTGEVDDDDAAEFAAIQLAIDTIANAAPRGSMGALILYYDQAEALRELGPLSTLHGDALGRSEDYTGKSGRNLVAALTRALDELDQAPHMPKAVIIAGDGADNQLDTSPDAMRALRERARRSDIVIYAIEMDAGIGDAMSALRYVAPRQRFSAMRVLDIVPAFEGTFRDFLAGAPAPEPDVVDPAPAPAAQSGHRTLAWSLLAAGVALGAFAGAVLLRRRLLPTGRSS